MDISHTCTHCFKGKKVYRVTFDLFNEEGILRRGVQQMKKFEFECEHCSKKSFLDFYRFSHPDVILLLKRLDQRQYQLLEMLNKLIDVLEEYVKS